MGSRDARIRALKVLELWLVRCKECSLQVVRAVTSRAARIRALELDSAAALEVQGVAPAGRAGGPRGARISALKIFRATVREVQGVVPSYR